LTIRNRLSIATPSCMSQSTASAPSAFDESPEATEMRLLPSKKLPGIRLIPVELEIGRRAPAKGAQPVEENPSLGLARDAECALAGHVHLNLIAWLELQRFDNRRGKADGEAVAPFWRPA
jgi:hypothetical protein